MTLKQKKIDKNSIQYLKYRDIALEFIKNGYSNIRAIYKRYYPKATDYSIDCEAYRLLDNDRFKMVMEEVYKEIKVEDLDLASEALMILRNKMFDAKKESDRITAAIAIGKFTIGEKNRTTLTEDRKVELEGIAKRLGIINLTASEN